MLHHSNSRQQRNRGSKIKTLLKVTILLGVAVWLVYQVKHSYDKKNEYYNATEDQLSHDDRSMFQGRKERLGTYGDGNVEKAIETTDVISKQEEEKGGESVFEKENADSHDDDAGKTEAEEGQASRADDNAEAHHNDEDEATGHSAEVKHDAESNSSDAGSKVGDNVPQNNGAQEEIAGEISGEAHEHEEHSNGSSNAGQIDASINGSDGGQADSEPLFEDTKAGTGDEHSGETLPDETGSIPAVHNENPQGDAASSTSDAYGHSSSETVHVDIGSEHEGATTSSGDAEKGNSVGSNPSDSNLVEEKAGTASGGEEKGTANEASGAKEANPQEGNAATETHTDQAANTQTENSKGGSAAEGAIGSVEETKPVENQVDGATKASNNGDQDNIKIETNTSANDEHNEHQSVDASSGSSGSNDSGPEQTGKTETQ